MTKPIKFYIDIPPWDSLTPQEQEAPGYPITVGYESIEDFARHITAASPTALADEVVQRVVKALDYKKARQATTPTAPPSDDAIVDQRTAPVPKSLYLRLAREKAFPSVKIGKRICARWGDVRAAFAAYNKKPDPPDDPGAPPQPQDGLDDLRGDLGLVKKADE